MSVDLFFSAPLIVEDVEPTACERIRAKVAAFLESERAKQTVVPAPEESVATSFYMRDASILADAELEELESIVLSTAKAYLEQTLKLPPRHLEIEQAWINVFEPGAQEGQHTHDGSLLSCSYYVDAPEDCGCIVFPDPIGARRSYREFTRTAGSELLTRREIAVEPQPGRLVMFESWMPHYVQCNKSDRVRVSIAINLREASPAPSKASASGDEAPAAAGPNRDRGRPSASTAAQAASRPAPRPFLFDQLFSVNSDLVLKMQPVRDLIPTIVIDDFLQHPEEVRDLVGSMPAANWKHEEGGRNFVDYYDCRLRFPIRYPNSMIAAAHQAIRRVYRFETRPADPSVDVNWFMQINKKRGDFAVPHADITENVSRSFTCIVYLNRRDECSGGTAFFRFRKSDSLTFDETYARAAHEDSRIAESGLDYWPDRAEELWERVGEVEMVPGRLLIFPSEHFHAAYHSVNSFYDFPRLTLAYWMIC